MPFGLLDDRFDIKQECRITATAEGAGATTTAEGAGATTTIIMAGTAPGSW